jgi:hypothetical protein
MYLATTVVTNEPVEFEKYPFEFMKYIAIQVIRKTKKSQHISI